MKNKKIPAYHLFKVYDDCFLLETLTRHFYKIDQLTYEYLYECQTSSIEAVRNKMISNGIYDVIDIESAYREIKLLSANGLFDSPENYIDELYVKRYLDNYAWGNNIGGVELSLANCCNFACKYCYCSKFFGEEEKMLMNNETAKLAIDILLANTPSQEINITLFGGEPLLNKSVIDFIIDYAPIKAHTLGKKINFIMTTNGSMLDDKIIDHIIKYNFGLMISMDGPKELHDYLCPTKTGKKTFDLVMSKVKKLKERRHSLAVRATLTHPVPNIADMVNFFEQAGFTKIVMGPALNTADTTSKYSFTKEDFISLSRQDEALLPNIIESIKNKKIPGYFKYSIGINAISQGRLNGRIIRCSAASTNFCVNNDGKFYPCHRFIGMDAWVIGDIEKGIDKQACKSFWENYYYCIKEYCGNCFAYPVCDGPCPWELVTATGQFVFNDNRCRYIRRYMEQSVYIYFKLQTFFENNALSDIYEIIRNISDSSCKK